MTAPASRVGSVDLIRGVVMILMAIDHVRVFSGLPAGGPTYGIFFTRWVTHFCAPAFIFLAGTSAYLSGRKRGSVSRHLAVRGVWLVLLELTLLRLAWTFNLDFSHYGMAGVIWCIGWCMILLAGLVKLPLPVVAAFGLATIGLHDLVDPHLRAIIGAMPANSYSGLWKVLYLGFFAGPASLGTNGLDFWVLYSIVPWIGVMAAGYAFGKVLTLDAARRDRMCLALGLGAVALFLILRGLDGYGDPFAWHKVLASATTVPALLAFLNVNKYPASLDFLLMTLGPALALMPVLNAAQGPVARAITVFGRVPFSYYVLHIPLVHLLALGVSTVRLGHVDPWLFANHPMGNPPAPAGSVWSLPLLYAVWAAAILILYPACRWFAAVKARRTEWWLRYL